MEAVAARVADGGCHPEAWTLQLLPRSLLPLGATVAFSLVAMGNLAVATFAGGEALALLASFVYLASAWMVVVAPVEVALDDLTGDRAATIPEAARRLRWAFLTSLPLALLQTTLFCGVVAGLMKLAAAFAPHSAFASLAALPAMLWFHVATVLTLVRRRLRSGEPWLYSLVAGHGQVLRFFPLGLVDVARDWAERSRRKLGRYPGVPGQGTVHSRVGIAWALDVGVGALGIAAGVAVARALGYGLPDEILGIAVGSTGLALGAYLAAMNLAHAYAGYLTYAGGHLDAWLEAGGNPEALPSGTDAPPPELPADPSGAAASGAG
jgi:hypothetical protein